MSDTDTPVVMRSGSTGPTTKNVAIAFGAITFVVISLRLFSRAYVIRHVGVDDVLIVCAACCTWAFMVCNIVGVDHGLGDHLEVVQARGAQNFSDYLRIVFVSSIFYNASLGFIKCSVLWLYTRLGDRQLRKVSFVVMGICACSATANVLVCIFQCAPIKATWDLTITKKTCINVNGFYLANAATNITTDLLAYLLPMRLVKNLQIPTKQKVAVGVMLCLGLMACVSSIVRITFIPVMLSSPDPTYVIGPPFYWSVIESNIGVLAASIPSFKPLAKRFLPRLLDSSRNNQTPGFSKQSDNSRPLKSGNSGFGKLDSSQGIYMNDITKDDKTMISTYETTPGSRRANTNSALQSHKPTNLSNPSDLSDTRYSHSSEEYIMNPGKDDIVRTVEISTTVETEKNNKTGRNPDIYPGYAV